MAISQNQCPACGAWRHLGAFKVKFCRLNHALSTSESTSPHLDVTCVLCGYVWFEATATELK